MKKYSRKEVLTAYGMIAPAFILLLIFAIIPIVMACVNSFYNYGFYQDPVFVGLKNYRQVLKDKYFWRSIVVGIKYTALVVPFLLILSFLFANMVAGLKGKVGSFVKTSIYVPTVISGVIASMLFLFIYDYQAGLLNTILKLFGILPQAWLKNPKLALLSVAVPRIWLSFGYTTLFMLGGLLDIPASYYEAAKLDGATGWQCMTKITMPLMKNIFLFLFVSNIVSTMQEFDLPYNMTGGSPAGKTLTPSVFVFNHFTGDATIGFSLAAAMLIPVVLGGVSSVVFKTVNSEKAQD